MPVAPSAASTVLASKSSSSCPGSTRNPTSRTWHVSGLFSATWATSTPASSCPRAPVAAKWPTRPMQSARPDPMRMSEAPEGNAAAVAGHAPAAVYQPQSLTELREVVMQADLLTLVPAGGRTQLDLGQPPESPFAL